MYDILRIKSHAEHIRNIAVIRYLTKAIYSLWSWQHLLRSIKLQYDLGVYKMLTLNSPALVL